jgi:hypothetical protein
VAITRPAGSRKTVFLRRFEAAEWQGRLRSHRSLSADKDGATLAALIAALFYDVLSERDPRIPSQGEERERALPRVGGRDPRIDGCRSHGPIVSGQGTDLCAALRWAGVATETLGGCRPPQPS